MRRYIYSGDAISERHECDILIVGSGIAGLYAALHVPENLRVTLITKASVDRSNSWLAQGGIASVIDPTDHFESHIEDTLKAGAGLCDPKAVELLVTEGPDNIRELVRLGVPFDKKPDGELMITREGGHSCRRIVHCGGDATGRETTRKLAKLVQARENIEILTESHLVDILTDDNGVTGAVVLGGGEPMIIDCPDIIIATGGIGALYEHTTNPSGAVGDGIAAAGRAGAVISDMEFVQFHPTTMTPQSGQIERRFLISEAVRGEGGILRNRYGEAFMKGKHPLADLAPRDIVTREIIKEMERIGDDKVYLDVSSMSEEFFERRFPTIFGECKRFGIDIPKAQIPVRPAQHYLMGGIKTDLDGRTNVAGLYAAGECASTGIHGGNRLASNSMLECLVFGRRAALAASDDKRIAGKAGFTSSLLINENERSDEYYAGKRKELRAVMTSDANAVRTPKGLRHGKDFVDSLIAELDSMKLSTKAGYELYSMAMAADYILTGAIERKESVGAHYVVPDKE